MSGPVPEPCLYVGRVMHARLRPVRHKFAYRVFSLFLDLDRVGDLAAVTRGFAYNRPGLLSFYDRDHGPRTGDALRPWVEGRLHDAGLEPDGGAIRLLCFPRLLGYVFNPLSIYYCYGKTGALRALVYQVHNTFGEAHSYVCPVAGGDGVIEQSVDKNFYVSPFIEMEGGYVFRLKPPGERLAIAIRESGAAGPTLLATHQGSRKPFTAWNVLTACATHPLMTVKVVAGIHWEALRLWLKGVRLAPATSPAAPRRAI